MIKEISFTQKTHEWLSKFIGNLTLRYGPPLDLGGKEKKWLQFYNDRTYRELSFIEHVASVDETIEPFLTANALRR